MSNPNQAEQSNGQEDTRMGFAHQSMSRVQQLKGASRTPSVSRREEQDEAVNEKEAEEVEEEEEEETTAPKEHR